MTRDKKNNSKNIKLMLIKKIGGPIIEKEFSKDSVKLFLKKRLLALCPILANGDIRIERPFGR